MPTNFDLMCSFAESCGGHPDNVILKTIRKTVRAARLFKIERDSSKTDLSVEERILLGSEFHLPFPIVAIEDAESCVLIMDEDPESAGFDKERFVVYAYQMAESKYVSGGRVFSSTIMSNGDIKARFDQDSLFYCEYIGHSWTNLYTWSILANHHEQRESIQYNAMTHFYSAIREILFSNVPSNFIFRILTNKNGKIRKKNTSFS